MTTGTGGLGAVIRERVPPLLAIPLPRSVEQRLLDKR
jgi:hypothetical protein